MNSDMLIDLEGDNLLPDTSTIWVISCKIVGSDEIKSFFDKESFVDYYMSVKPRRIIGHNIIGYDLPVMRKIWGLTYKIGIKSEFMGVPVQVIDTLLLSQMWPDRPGGHALEDWGNRLGIKKGSFSDWSRLSDEMIEYNRQDLKVNEPVYNYLCKEMMDEYFS